MSNARKKALIAVQAIMVVLFVVAVLLGMGAKNVKAETVNGASDQTTAAEYVDGLMVNGNVSSTYDAKTVYATQNSTPLTSADDVKAFLTTDTKKVRRWENGAWKDYPDITATIGYLYLEDNANKDSIEFSWNGTLTNGIMKEGRTFDGAGKKIVLTANGALNTDPWQAVSSISAGNTFITANSAHSDVDLNGAFIGCIPVGTTVKNTNFVNSGNISGSQNTDGSGCGGFIAGFCRGVVDNCSVTVSGSFTMNKTAAGSGTSISRNTYAFGGLVGVLAGGRVSNSSVNHLGNLTVNVTTASKGYGRAWLGGIVGFMADGAKAYNLTTAGTGSLNANVSNGNSGYTGLGIAVGCCTYAYDTSKYYDGADALAGTSDPGTIDGVINSWTGSATGYSRWATYSPTAQENKSFTVQGIIVGFSGHEFTRDKNDLSGCQPSGVETVSNIYSCIGDIYTDSVNCTVGHSFAVKNGDVAAPRNLFNEINITRRMDNENSSSKAPAQESYVTWADTNEKSDLMTVVDITDNEAHLLWSDSVRKYNQGVEIENLRNTYFNLSETFADARNDYKITYTSLKRGAYQKIEFNYILGRAVYVKQVLGNGNAMTGTEEFSAIQYGNELDVPKIELYTSSDYSGAPVETIAANTYSYWKTLKDGSKSLDPASGIKPLGTYTTFLYLNNAADGTNYSNIHLLDTTDHYVAYIKDDKNFKDFVKDNPDYSHVDLQGVKNYDWQPKVQQSVVAKKISFTIDPPNIGIDVNGVREVEYQGTTISYSASVRDEIQLENGEKTIVTVTANLEYYKTDSNFSTDEDKMELVPEGAIDAGYYIVRAASLNNSNYEIDQVADRRLYIKKKLTFVFFDETKVTEINDEYHLNIEYSGDEQEIQGAPSKDSLTLEEMARRNLTFCVYNINVGDEQMLQIASYGIDDGDYDEIFATNVSAKDENGNYIGSYKVKISFADGKAASNYSLPEITTFVVTIVPATVDWQNPTKKEFIYGDKTPESDGYYAYGIAKDGVTTIEPTEAKYYKRNASNGWDEIFTSPKNVGEYRITYYIRNIDEPNYSDSEHTYTVKITQRAVSFSMNEIQSQYNLPDKDPLEVGAGKFTGLSREHSRSNQVEFRYQRVGDPLDDEMMDPEDVYEYETLDSFDDISQLPSQIWDAGCYIVYPILLLSCGRPDLHPEGGIHYVYNEYNRSEYDNYTFDLHTTYVNVLQRKVNIQLKSLEKEYSKAMTWGSFKANDKEADRAWIYDGKARFREEDNIVIELKTNADEHSAITGDGEKGMPITVKSMLGVGEEGYGLDINKAGNYIITVTNTEVDSNGETCSYVKVLPLTINVRVYTDKNTLTYGDSSPEPEYRIEGDNRFMSDDNMRPNYVYSIGDTVLTELPTYLSVGTYEVSVEFDTFNADKIGNYNIVINGSAVFVVNPKEIDITKFEINGESVFEYNGEHQHPNVDIEFDGVVGDDEISVEYIFYDKNGVRVSEPQNVGTYTARVEGNKVSNKEGNAINENYVLIRDAQYYREKYHAEVTIEPVHISIKVNNATRFYHIPTSLQALKPNTQLKEGKKYADSDYIVKGELPYTILSGEFFDEISYRLITYTADTEDQYDYFDEADKVYNGVVRIEFTGDAIDAGNYVIDEEESIWGSLHVLKADFDEISDYLYVTYEGKRIGRDIDAKDVVYTGENIFDKFSLFAHNENIYDQLSWKFTDADGKDVNGVIKDAGDYKMVITGVGDEPLFKGEHTIPFTVNQAVRNITAADIRMEVHYNKLVFSSDIPGLVYSINAVDGVDAWRTPTNGTYVYTNVNSLNNYFIRIKVEQGYDPNYYDSNILEIFVQTGINVGDLADQFNAIDTITFSNLAVYLALKDRIGFVHADDMGAVPTDKIAQLDASMEKLISDANAAVAGAQNVTAKAMGKSNNSKTVATAMALSSASLGLGAVGLMLGSIVAKKRKEDEMEVEQAKVKKANGKKFAKRFVIVIAIMLVAVMALAGCKDETMKQEELLDLASYNTPSNEKSRDYDITVSHESTIIYRNVNGVETTVNENISAPKFELGSTGSGLDFNVDYFENISYVTSKSTATFTADVKNVSAFLGIDTATDASVTVVADIQNKRLNSIEITYSEGSFKTIISTTLNY